MISFIIDAESLDELAIPPNYCLHPMMGDRLGTWSMTLTRNWRLTFTLSGDGAISDVDLEDYH